MVDFVRIVVAMIEETTIKKVYFKDNNLMILELINTKYESKFFTMKEVEKISVRIIGLVRFVETDFV